MSIKELSHSPACERNTPVLLEFLSKNLHQNKGDFLEIGFGTGQHAFAITKEYPQINYYAADQETYHPHLLQRINVLGRPDNLFGPYSISATPQTVLHNIPQMEFSTIFSANTLHIMSWPEATALLNFIPKLLDENAQLFIYGPFKFGGKFTSESNHYFDLSLKENSPHMGIRDFEGIKSILEKHGLKSRDCVDLPANNNILIFDK